MKKRILIVDDDDDIRSTLEFGLQLEGYDVISASRGIEGLQKARTSGPDLMILDLRLPDMPGEAICKELRDNDGNKVPIIMLTGKDRDVDEVIGLVAGATEYIRKPFDMPALLDKIFTLTK